MEAGRVMVEAVEGTEAVVPATGITAAVLVEAVTEVTAGTEVQIEIKLQITEQFGDSKAQLHIHHHIFRVRRRWKLQ